jgi:hypothetical protein
MFAKKITAVIFITGGILLQAQTPPPSAAPARTLAAQAAAQQTDMCVSRAAIALDIENHEPKDTGMVFPPEVKRLYCFSEIKNGEGNEIQHRWYWKDEMITSVPLKISTNRFRTQSAKTIPPEMTGDWRVAIVNSKDESILKMLSFTVK